MWRIAARKQAEIGRKLDERIAVERAWMATQPKLEQTVEEHQQALRELDAMLRADVAAFEAKLEEEWRRVRAALLKRRAAEKQARRRRGRGPP